jgi:hypothetical protein
MFSSYSMSYPAPYDIYAPVPEPFALRRWNRVASTVSSHPVSLKSSILEILNA